MDFTIAIVLIQIPSRKLPDVNELNGHSELKWNKKWNKN
jgi:hypothetical protein